MSSFILAWDDDDAETDALGQPEIAPDADALPHDDGQPETAPDIDGNADAEKPPPPIEPIELEPIDDLIDDAELLLDDDDDELVPDDEPCWQATTPATPINATTNGPRMRDLPVCGMPRMIAKGR